MADRHGCDNSSAGQTGTEMRSWFQDHHDTAVFQGCVLASLWTAELSVNKHLAHLVLCAALGHPMGWRDAA